MKTEDNRQYLHFSPLLDVSAKIDLFSRKMEAFSYGRKETKSRVQKQNQNKKND